MSRKSNDLLAELRVLGLIEGVAVTVDEYGTSVWAGSVSASSKDDDSELALETALQSLLGKIKAAPKQDRPEWFEATTRTIADPDLSGGPRSERPVTVEDR